MRVSARARHRGYSPPPSVVYVDAPTAAYYVDPVAPSVSASSEAYRDARHKNFVFGLDFQVLNQGGAAALHLGFEGERLGLMLRAGALSLRADDGSGGLGLAI